MTYTTRWSSLLVAGIGLMVTVIPSRAGPPNNDVSDSLRNTAGGTGALQNNTTGFDNTAFGFLALANNTAGNSNTAFGKSALRFNIGSQNTAVGLAALGLNTASGNTAVGYSALLNNSTGNSNSAFGDVALVHNTTGSNNTAVGYEALDENINGTSNTAVGTFSLFSDISGANNVAMGVATLENNTSGASNIAVGVSALQSNTTGNGNIAIGIGAGAGLFSGSSNIYLGAQAAATSESNTMRLGHVQSSTFIAGVRGRKTGLANAVEVFIDSNGQLGTIKSAARFKEDIHDMGDYSRGLYNLRPVTYHYKEPTVDGAKPFESGLIAEEVAKEYPDLVAYGNDGQIETVQYHKLTPMLLNEVQRQEQALDMQASDIADVKAQNQALHASINELKAEMETAHASRGVAFVPRATDQKTATH